MTIMMDTVNSETIPFMNDGSKRDTAGFLTAFMKTEFHSITGIIGIDHSVSTVHVDEGEAPTWVHSSSSAENAGKIIYLLEQCHSKTITQSKEKKHNFSSPP